MGSRACYDSTSLEDVVNLVWFGMVEQFGFLNRHLFLAIQFTCLDIEQDSLPFHPFQFGNTNVHCWVSEMLIGQSDVMTHPNPQMSHATSDPDTYLCAEPGVPLVRQTHNFYGE